MPAPCHFGKLQARALTDSRILRASDLYVEAKIARAETALATVLGHVAMLGLWAVRDTNDGAIPGDGVALVASATLCGPTIARKIVPILRAPDVDLITGEPGALRLRGFQEAYGSMVTRREGNAERNALMRAKKGAACASRDAHAPHHVTTDVTGAVALEKRREEKREEENPPPSAVPPRPTATAGGSASPSSNGAANGHDPAKPRPPDARQVAGARAMAAVILGGKDVAQSRRDDAKWILRSLDSGTATADDVSSFAERHFGRTECRVAYLSPP